MSRRVILGGGSSVVGFGCGVVGRITFGTKRICFERRFLGGCSFPSGVVLTGKVMPFLDGGQRLKWLFVTGYWQIVGV